MTNVTREQVIEYIGSMSVAELPDFIDELKEKLKIKDIPVYAAAAPGGGAAVAAGSEDDAASASAEKSLYLTGPGSNKVPVIKAMRECMPNLSLTDAKKQLDEFSDPIFLKKGTKEELDKVKTLFESAGATVEIK